MSIVSMKELLESGVHFGHRTSKWNPYMKPYIFTERNDIHIIDLQQTVEGLEESYEVIRDTVAKGGEVLFVGTKRQAQDIIKKYAEKVNMPYVIGRWLGGTLTNWQTIRERIQELERLEAMRDRGEFELRPKKEALGMQRQIERLLDRLGGIRKMDGLPDILFVVDVFREEIPVHEANLLKIPVVAVVDTNCNPKNIDYVIPANDDAIRGIQLIVSKIAQAVQEGVNMRKDREAEMEAAEAEAQLPEELRDELSDEELLGESTLEKMQEEQEKETQKKEEKAEAEVETESEETEEEIESPEADAEPTKEEAEKSDEQESDEEEEAEESDEEETEEEKETEGDEA
ncbi:MAG: 30S ribosomal protein S2 [Anaerolineales bacterium]|nr:30S ribosomal protein S2 [Anaerolineales bacterium]